MSTRKSARRYINFGDVEQNSTTARFIQNHHSPEHLLRQLTTQFEAGQIHEVSRVIECIIENYSPLITWPELFTLHAKVYIELYGFNVHAQCSLTQALLLDPYHREALELQTLARYHEDLRDGLYETTEQRLEEFLAESPENPYASFLLANHLFWKNGPETKVVGLLEETVRQRPAFLRAWLCLAMAYKRGQNSEKAENAFQECLGLDTNATNKEFYKKHLQSL